MGRCGRLVLVSVVLLAATGAWSQSPVPATVTAIEQDLVTVTVPAGTMLATGQWWADGAAGLRGHVERISGRQVQFRLAAPWPELRLGSSLALAPASETALVESAPAATAMATGSVTRVEGDQVWVAGPAPDTGLPGELRRGGEIAGGLAWQGGVTPQGDRPAIWQGVPSMAPPQLGETVTYTAAPQAPSALGNRGHDAPRRLPSGAVNPQRIVSGDDPLMRAFETLAGGGHIAGAGRRQFAGHGVVVYTREELARFLLPTVEEWVGDYSAEDLPRVAGQPLRLLTYLISELRNELAGLGATPDEALTRLARGASKGVAVLPSAGADVRLNSGRDSFDARARATVTALPLPRTMVAATLSSESLCSFPEGRDRTTLDTLWGEWRPFRSLRVGGGRAAFRLGSGFDDLLWSDSARPPDRLEVDWQTKVFGRPFRIEQHFGAFHHDTTRYVTLRRLEWQPLRILSIAGTEALITDRAGQGLMSNVLPLYAARFVSGNSKAGGHGNYLGSFEAVLRPAPSLSVYAEYFADEFDFSPAPPRTSQRTGILAGVLYAPRSARPGTSLRLEWASLPYTGTYTGQLDKGLAWMRGGYVFGHPYGADSMGVRWLARHRFTDRLDVSLGGEAFNQMRGEPIKPATLALELGAGYDLTRRWSVGLGYRYQHRTNIGGVGGSDRVDHGVFLETRLGY